MRIEEEIRASLNLKGYSITSVMQFRVCLANRDSDMKGYWIDSNSGNVVDFSG